MKQDIRPNFNPIGEEVGVSFYQPQQSGSWSAVLARLDCSNVVLSGLTKSTVGTSICAEHCSTAGPHSSAFDHIHTIGVARIHMN